MKALKTVLLVIFSSLLLVSCGIHTTTVRNVNSNLTNVQLSTNNFKVVDRVSGKSTATYILGIGGLSTKALIEKAKSRMLEKASLIGGSKAIINVTTEDHVALIFPFFYRKTITVSAHVIEFTE